MSTYIILNEVAATVLLACETDFVSKNQEFVALAKEIAMQVAATNPTITKEQVPAEALKKLRKFCYRSSR